MFGFPSWAVYLVAGFVMMGVGAKGASIYYGREIAAIELAQAAAKAEALKEGQRLQRDADQVTIDLTGAQVVVQEKIVFRAVQIQKEIPIYVQDTSNCITWGLVRVLDAGANGVDPASLVLPPGKFNDSCAPFGAALLADRIVGNYGLHRQNAEQIGGLQETLLRLKAVLESATPTP